MKFLLVAVVLVSVLALGQAAAVDTPVVAVVDESKDGPAAEVTTPNPEVIDQDCYQPKETGRCFALFYRYAYNVENRACEEFVYGGCAGNSNNFETREDCEKKCMNNATETATAVDDEPKATEKSDVL